MADVRLGVQLPDGRFVGLTAGEESDGTLSLQVVEPEARLKLDAIASAFTATAGQLAAAAASLEAAAQAEQAETATILANVASLIAAAQDVDLAANQLVTTLNATIGDLAATQQLVQLMATAMQVSFGSLEDVRSVVQAMLNSMQTLLASSVPLPVPLDPVGEAFYDEALAVPGHLETNLVQLTVPIGQTLVLTGFTATGSTEARYRLYIGAARKLAARSSAADRTARGVFLERALPRAAPGLLVRLTVEHPEGFSGNFEGTIHGYFTAP